jgi:fermentation-respiration switch protein FrsA (DUF1100 family)
MRYVLVLVALSIAGCMRLDDNLLSPGDAITEYKLDDYTGEVDFRLDPSMKITRFAILDLKSGGLNGEPLYNIKGVYLGDTNRIRTDTIIVYCHGYNHHMDFYWPRASLLANVGGKNRYGVMMMDYRGYGLSEGEPTEQGLYDDVNAAIRWLESKGLTSDRLVIYGFSLGGAPAIYHAAEHSVMNANKLITESAFASPELLEQDATKLSIPGSYFTNVKADNATVIQEVKVPYLNFHGDADAFINFTTHALEIRKNYKGPKLTAITVPGADHEDLPEVMGFDKYMLAIENFLTGH